MKFYYSGTFSILVSDFFCSSAILIVSVFHMWPKKNSLSSSVAQEGQKDTPGLGDLSRSGAGTFTNRYLIYKKKKGRRKSRTLLFR